MKVTLPFRNGRVETTFANLGAENGWAWVALRVDKPREEVILVRAVGLPGLQAALKHCGFCVPPGSPAERVMLAAVKLGFAEELPEDERWNEEVIRLKGELRQRERGFVYPQRR